MKKERISELREYFLAQLLNNVLPFWIKNGIDHECGGYITYLDRKGSILCTDKSMWIQGRTAWLFARLYNELELREEWLKLSQHGIEFIKKYGFDIDGRVFFTVTRDGQPLRKRRYLFSETFAIIALAEYSRASGSKEDLELARKILEMVLFFYKNPYFLPQKIYPQTRKLSSLSLPMILINTIQILRNADHQDERYNKIIDDLINDIFTYFAKSDRNILLETVGVNGEFLDTPQGRCIDPGHEIEACWFIMEEGRYRNDYKLIEKMLPFLDSALELGWDDQYGGLFYFVDIDGKQAEPLEWDMKLWWPHNEAIYATALAHFLTGEDRYLDWFEKILEWSLRHFPDKEYGEWFGYLHRDGTVALDYKGNNWKGPFHLPRQLLYSYLLFSEMHKEIESSKKCN